MIPDIGVMIGAYILTRMLSILTRKDANAGAGLVKGFAYTTMLITIISMISLVMGGVK